MLTEDSVKSVFEAAHKSFPNLPVVQCACNVELQIYAFPTSESVNICWFQLKMLFRSSFSVAKNLVPLSDQITTETPRLATNLLISTTQLVVYNDDATSKFTAPVVKQVKRKPNYFFVDHKTDT